MSTKTLFEAIEELNAAYSTLMNIVIDNVNEIAKTIKKVYMH